MRKVLVATLALCLVAVSLGVAVAGSNPKRLGTDPAGDSAPAIDITYLDFDSGAMLTENGPVKALDIRIGVDGMLPTYGSIPEVPAFEWIFTTGKRMFIAEAVASHPEHLFFLFELKGDTYEQLIGATGKFDVEGGFIQIVVPLETIGAKRGTVVSGVKEPLEVIGNNGADVDVHIHAGSETIWVDEMTTAKSFVVR